MKYSSQLVFGGLLSTLVLGSPSPMDQSGTQQPPQQMAPLVKSEKTCRQFYNHMKNQLAKFDQILAEDPFNPSASTQNAYKQIFYVVENTSKHFLSVFPNLPDLWEYCKTEDKKKPQDERLFKHPTDLEERIPGPIKKWYDFRDDLLFAFYGNHAFIQANVMSYLQCRLQFHPILEADWNRLTIDVKANLAYWYYSEENKQKSMKEDEFTSDFEKDCSESLSGAYLFYGRPNWMLQLRNFSRRDEAGISNMAGYGIFRSGKTSDTMNEVREKYDKRYVRMMFEHAEYLAKLVMKQENRKEIIAKWNQAKIDHRIMVDMPWTHAPAVPTETTDYKILRDNIIESYNYWYKESVKSYANKIDNAEPN